MDRNILFFSDDALALNAKVQNDVGKHLVLFCNYDPTLPEVFSEDAKFLKAVANLYKLLVDSAVVDIIEDVSNAGGLHFNTRKLRNYRRLSSELRSALYHNPTDMMGDSENLQAYKNWLKRCNGKEKIENEEDYKKPLEELKKMAEDVVSILDQFVEQVASVSDKEEEINAWEEGIIKFYCKPSNENIFKQEIKNFYAAFLNANYENSVKDRDVAEWIKTSYYLFTELEEISNLKKSQSQYQGNRSLEEKISNAIVIHEGNLKKQKEKMASKYNITVDELDNKIYYYEDYYFEELYPKMKKALSKIKGNGETMMPYDIMQEVFKEDFKNVNLPGDL